MLPLGEISLVQVQALILTNIIHGFLFLSEPTEKDEQFL